MKRSVLTLAVAVATVASWITAPTVGATPVGCTTSGLVVWLDTAGEPAAGSVDYKLEFTNQSGLPCTLTGYPGVSAIDLRQIRVGSPGSHGSSVRPAVVQLANGATATAVLRFVDARNFPPAKCRPRDAAGLRVYPPNQSASKLIPFPFEACSSRGPIVLNVDAATR
jgi:Protein of unknown function (DUF4232)